MYKNLLQNPFYTVYRLKEKCNIPIIRGWALKDGLFIFCNDCIEADQGHCFNVLHYFSNNTPFMDNGHCCTLQVDSAALLYCYVYPIIVCHCWTCHCFIYKWGAIIEQCPIVVFLCHLWLPLLQKDCSTNQKSAALCCHLSQSNGLPCCHDAAAILPPERTWWLWRDYVWTNS